MLAVLVEGHPARDLLQRARAVARARGTRLHPVLLRLRTPLTTDPALIPQLVRRRRHDLDRLSEALTLWAPEASTSEPEVIAVSGHALLRGGQEAWREVQAVARRRAAPVVVVPLSLAAAAAQSGRSARPLAVVVIGGAR